MCCHTNRNRIKRDGDISPITCTSHDMVCTKHILFVVVTIASNKNKQIEAGYSYKMMGSLW